MLEKGDFVTITNHRSNPFANNAARFAYEMQTLALTESNSRRNNFASPEDFSHFIEKMRVLTAADKGGIVHDKVRDVIYLLETNGRVRTSSIEIRPHCIGPSWDEKKWWETASTDHGYTEPMVVERVLYGGRISIPTHEKELLIPPSSPLAMEYDSFIGKTFDGVSGRFIQPQLTTTPGIAKKAASQVFLAYAQTEAASPELGHRIDLMAVAWGLETYKELYLRRELPERFYPKALY